MLEVCDVGLGARLWIEGLGLWIQGLGHRAADYGSASRRIAFGIVIGVGMNTSLTRSLRFQAWALQKYHCLVTISVNNTLWTPFRFLRMPFMGLLATTMSSGLI